MGPKQTTTTLEEETSSYESNLTALTVLIKVFKDLSDERDSYSFEDLQREVYVRWKFWRDHEGWILQSAQGNGYFELHLRQDVLGIRCFKIVEGKEPISIVKLKVFLGQKEGLTANINFVDDPDAKFIGALLLERVSYSGYLQSLERSLARGLGRFLTSAEMEAMVDLY